MEGITIDGLSAAEAAIDAAISSLDAAQMKRNDAAIIQEEFTNAARMLKYACRRAKATLDPPSLDLPGQPRELADQLQRIIQSHRHCWLARNRPGGLSDSINRLV
jgi:hypothetical protein